MEDTYVIEQNQQRRDRGLLRGMLQRHPGAVLSVTAMLFVAAAVAALVWVWPKEQGIGEVGASLRSAVPALAVPAAPGGTADAAVPITIEPAPAADPPAPAPAGDAPAAALDGATTVGRADATVASDGTIELLRDGSDRLEFTFLDECWVEVRDRDGEMVWRDTHQGGQQLRITARAPFRVVLGYAPGVRLALNGQEVSLVPHTRNRIAQLVVGS